MQTEQTVVSLEAEVARLRAALEAIAYSEMVFEWREVDNDDCAECAVYRAKEFSVQHMCNDHMRQMYAEQDRYKAARGNRHIDLADIARRALADGDRP